METSFAQNGRTGSPVAATKRGETGNREGPAMSELSKDDVIKVLGSRLGDIAIAEIIATGISKDELLAAKTRVMSDSKAHAPGAPQEPGHISQVVDILERLQSNGLLGAAGSTLT